MNVAELFVNLGLKGSDSVGKSLKNVKGGLGEVKSMSLEAKAAIVGAIYALERMMSSSAQAGIGFSNFTALTGMSAQDLQRWQYAARQVGVQAEEVSGAFKGVQTNIANMLMGKGPIEGMAMVANKVGLDQSRLRDTQYVMGQLQKFAQTVPQDIGNQMLRSFGVSDNMISAMRRNAFREDVFKKAPVYGKGEVDQLDKVGVAMANVKNKFDMAFGRFTAKHGMQIVRDFDKIITSVFKLADALTILAEKVKVFELLARSLEGLSMIANGTSEGITGWFNKDNGMFANPAGFAKSLWKETSELAGQAGTSIGELITPSAPVALPPAKNQTINVNQNLNFQHEGKDHKKTGESVKKAVKDAYRQSSAQGQGS